MIFSLFKIYFSNIFSFFSFIDRFKKGPKGIIKNILILLLVIFCLGSFVMMNLMLSNNIYSQMLELNSQQLVPALSIFSSVLILFFFGFFSVATNYSNGSGEEQFLAMPLRPLDLFGAKFLLSVVTEFIVAVLIIITSSFFYAFKEHLLTNPLFYVGMVIHCVSVPLISIFIIFLLLILLLNFIPVLRNKMFLTGIAMIFVILFSFTMSNGLNMILGKLIEFGDMTKSHYFMEFIASPITGGIPADLCFIIVDLLIVFVFIPLLAPVYVNTLKGFSDVKNKKHENKFSGKEFDKSFRKDSVFKALYNRDVKTVLREPAFFANGPLIIILLPVIFGISFISGIIGAGSQLTEVLEKLSAVFMELNVEQTEQLKFFIVLIGTAVAIFMGNSTNIAITAFSREGKFFNSLKAMPIDYVELIKAKFMHAFTYCVISVIVICVFLSAGFLFFELPFTINEILELYVKIFILTSAASVWMIFVDMIIELYHPKMDWENPTACFKQNLNVVLSVFSSFLVAAIIGVLGFTIVPKNSIGFGILLVIFIVFSAVSGSFYSRKAVSKLMDM